MRGLAALTVVAYHHLLAYGPFTWPGFTLGRLTVLGDLPVAAFFVLSGFVLAESAAQRRTGLPLAILTRYLRLTVPMTASLVLAWLWLRVFPHAREAIQASGVNPWLSTAFITHQPVSLARALSDGLAGVYLTGTSFFNSVVWTMKIEFFGSVLIYLVYGLAPTRLRGLGLALIAATAVRNPFYLGFALGGSLREIRNAGHIPSSRWAWPALAAALALTTWPAGRTPIGFALLATAAALIVLTVLLAPSLQTALETAAPQFLGRISFSLYLVHAPLVVTVMAWYQLRAPGPPGLKFAVGLLAFTTLSLLLASALTRLLDEPLLRALHRLKGR